VVEVQGGDYSYTRPSPACLFDAGWRFACRYTSRTPAKNMSYDECLRLVNAGIWIVTIHQPSDGFLLEGFARGQVAAREALALAEDECGMPEDRPVYYTLDFDPNPLTTAQWDQVRSTLDGAASVTGRERVGIYGARLAVDTLVPDHAAWGWQTRSWSGVPPRWSPKAVLRQYDISTPNHRIFLCGGEVDRDVALADDFGQWDP